MKVSILLAVIILAVGLVAGLMHQEQLTRLREDRERLATRAAELGIHVESRSTADLRKPAGRHQAGRGHQTLPVLDQISAYRRAMEELRLTGDDCGPALQNQGFDLMERLMDLDPEEMKRVIDSLVAEKPLPEDAYSRQEMIELSIRMLAEDHPDVALSLFTDSRRLIDELAHGDTLIKTTLAHWARKDPLAALDWIRENSEDSPDVGRDELFHRIDRHEMIPSTLAGAAQTDPELAFKLLSETGTDRAYAIGMIAGAAGSPEDRTATLAAFRRYLTSVSDPKERESLNKKVLGSFVESLSRESFATATRWMAGQAFSAEERDELVRALPEEATIEESGKWIEWMAGALPPEKLGERVDRLIGAWAGKDCHEVAKWLGGQPDGTAKTAAIGAYARAAAQREPQSAVQWALTMPAGQEREDTLKRIYKTWHHEDPSAANAALQGMGLSVETLDSFKRQSGAVDDN